MERGGDFVAGGNIGVGGALVRCNLNLFCVMKNCVSVAVVALAGAALCGCNHNDNPPTEVRLPIAVQYVPESVVFDRNDEEAKELYFPWASKFVVVNSADELPDDPFGFPKGYTDLNFNNTTLLIEYEIRREVYVTLENRFLKNYADGKYQWYKTIGNGYYDEPLENEAVLTRYAIAVDKLPEDAVVEAWTSITAVGWDWGN